MLPRILLFPVLTGLVLVGCDAPEPELITQGENKYVTVTQETPAVTETQFGDQQSNALRQSVLSGPQTIQVSAYMVFDYATALDDVRIRN